MSVMADSVAGRLSRVQERIAAAARRAGRDPAAVALCVVTKGRPLAAVREAVAAGARILGENRVQEASVKIGEATDLPSGISWHLIGHLQRNKARRAVELFDLIQSVDSLALARRLAELGVARGRPVRAYVEVHTSGEATKTGLAPDGAGDAIAAMRSLPGLEVAGLMTMAPLTDDDAAIRASFTMLRRLGERTGLAELSMGMSSDFEQAVEEGATLVRVGSAIFE